MIGRPVVRYRNLAVGILIPLIVAALQGLLWSGLRPYTLEKARQFGFDQAYLEACL